jgi:hypothetical protein
MLVAGSRWGAIKHSIATTYGLSRKSVVHYLLRARRVYREESGIDLAEQRFLAFAFWDSIIRDPAASLRQKMKAMNRIVRMAGLSLPRR